MQIIKPLKLGLLHKTYRYKNNDYFAVTVLLHFHLKTQQILLDSDQWPKISEAIGQDSLFDQAMPKPYGEALLAGNVYTPDAEPMRKMRAQWSLGEIDKTMIVVGDRTTTKNPIGLWKTSSALPFTEMSMQWERSYGSPKEKNNPIGCGNTSFKTWLTGSKDIQQPNFYDEQLSLTPVMCVPEKVDWKKRQQLAGTYNKKWLKNDYPGLANDINWSYYNLAQADQQLNKGKNRKLSSSTNKYWVGNESYYFDGFHKEEATITGQLPSKSARAFVLNDENQFQEIKLNIDTVWLFPNELFGTLLFRGFIPCKDSDGLDLKQILIAYENQSDPSKPFAHYEQARRLKTEQETAGQYAFDDSLLSPIKTEVEHKTEQEENEQALTKYKEQQALIQSDLNNRFFKDHEPIKPNTTENNGVKNTAIEIDSSKINTNDKKIGIASALLKIRKPIIPLPSQQAMKRGDFNLVKTILKTEKLVKRLKSRAATLQKAANKELGQFNKPPSKPALKKTTLLQEGGKETRETSSSQLLKPLLHTKAVKETLGKKEVAALSLAVAGLDKAQRKSKLLTVPCNKKEVPDTCLHTITETNAPESDNALDWQSAHQVIDDNDNKEKEKEKLFHFRVASQDFPELHIIERTYKRTEYSDVDLTQSVFTSVLFEQCQFNQINFSQSTFDHCHFQQCHFEDCTLDGASLSKSKFTDCHINQSRMSDSKWKLTRLTNCELTAITALNIEKIRCDFIQTKIDMCVFMNGKLNDNLWESCEVHKSVFLDASIQVNQWKNSTIERCALTNAKLQLTQFDDCVLREVQTGGTADLTQCGFYQCILDTSGFRKISMRRIKFIQSSIKECDFGDTDLAQIVMHNTHIINSVFSSANLRHSQLANTTLYKCLCRKAQFNHGSLQQIKIVESDCFEAEFIQCKPFDVMGLDNQRIKKQAEVKHAA